jgi:superfamily II DNA or RNA helicase
MNPVLENAEFFSRPWSEINGKLFSYVQIVGAGKTLGMFSLPFAINQVINSTHIAAPRVDKMLVVTKESALRNQIANELMDEPVMYGIISEAPRVLEITSGDMLTSTDDTHDIAVMCPNMLWPNYDKDDESLRLSWSPLIEDVLRRYHIIIFDEMHYASRNVQRLIKVASQSMIFGFTASPLNENGELIEDIVLMGQPYGYTEAIINDQSMKGIW